MKGKGSFGSGSFAAKAAGWVGLTVCVVLFAGSICGIFAMAGVGAYSMSAQELRRQYFEQAASHYSVRALAAHRNGIRMEREFAETNYRGGIILAEKTDEIEQKLDLNDPKIYEDRNFTETIVDNDALHWFVVEVGPGTKFWVGESLFDSYSVTGISNSDAVITGETAEYYRVVSLLPEEVAEYGFFGGFGLFSDDLYVQANAVASLIAALRYPVFLVLAASVGLAVFLLVFLVCSAGRRKGTEKIVETWVDRIPGDVYLAAAGLFLLWLLCVSPQAAAHASGAIALLIFVAAGLCCCYLLLLTLLTVAVRAKTGRIWTNTWMYRICRMCGRGLRFLVEHMPLLWKAIVVMGGYSVFEFLVLLASFRYLLSGRLLLILFVRNTAIAAAALWGIVQLDRLREGGEKLAAGDLQFQIDTSRMYWELKRHGEHLNSIGGAMSKAVDERMKSERFKTELITNVSHDIKTPLTSIINYVDLLEKEGRCNEAEAEYIDVLERQSARLKKLIEDLIEASKASSGSLPVHAEQLEAGVFLVQTVGEFAERTAENQLELIVKKPEEPAWIEVDGRHFWRIIDNLMNNVCKYAQANTRVYIDLAKVDGCAEIIFRNTSKYPLNISGEELTERFVRGDASRNTEGSGLGLSIAQSLTELMRGTFALCVDGDLFKVTLRFPVVGERTFS